MPVHRPAAQAEARGDLLVALPPRQAAEHLELTRGQAPPVAGAPGRRRPARGGSPPAPQTRQLGSRRVELEVRGPVVARRPARRGQQEAGAGRLVGGLELEPEARCTTEQGCRGAGVATGQLDRPPRLRGRGEEHHPPVAARDGVELVARAPGALDLTGGEGDLDERGQEPRPLGPAVGRVNDPRIAADAASTRPRARSSSARPGCGSQPAGPHR